jgi:hypothetical protein
MKEVEDIDDAGGGGDAGSLLVNRAVGCESFHRSPEHTLISLETSFYTLKNF